MEQEFKKYLPIGSVVMLKSGTKRIMITGFVQIDKESMDRVYDYCGCLYPEGVVSTDNTLLFNHADISQIYCIGFRDDEQRKFMEKLTESMTEENLNKILEKLREQNNN